MSENHKIHLNLNLFLTITVTRLITPMSTSCCNRDNWTWQDRSRFYSVRLTLLGFELVVCIKFKVSPLKQVSTSWLCTLQVWRSQIICISCLENMITQNITIHQTAVWWIVKSFRLHLMVFFSQRRYVSREGLQLTAICVYHLLFNVPKRSHKNEETLQTCKWLLNEDHFFRNRSHMREKFS